VTAEKPTPWTDPATYTPLVDIQAVRKQLEDLRGTETLYGPLTEPQVLTPALNPEKPLAFRVYGKPETQGSTKAFVIVDKKTKKHRAVITSDNTDLKPWRALVVKAAQAQMLAQYSVNGISKYDKLFDCPAFVVLDVILPRLASHPKTSRGKEPGPPTGKNDLDKHQRAIGDALADAGVLIDDGCICGWLPNKRYARLGEEPGVSVLVMRYDQRERYITINYDLLSSIS
jgi:Holliday junction resolvase RusA-like endonuclease